ncbi:YfhO family protein [Candidatus Curtissbacteria bacterium]|nr:YfhO family protein [Candidatus Curtissbacteria bacterium]
MKLKILLLLTFLSLILFWPIFLSKVNLNGHLLVSFYAPYGENLPYKNTGWDQLRIYLPFYKVTLDAFRSGSVPFWNPFAFSGHPHMADFQTAVFYPLNILGFFMSQVEFWHLLRITPTILGAFFMYLFLRNLSNNVILGSETTPESAMKKDSGQARMTIKKKSDGKLSMLASIFGAITFGFSPFILTWGEEVVMSPHSVVWLPLILWAIDKFLATDRRQYLALISLGVGASLLGGYMQTTIYLLIFSAAYLIFRIWQIVHLRGAPFDCFDYAQYGFAQGKRAHLGGVIQKLFQAGLGILIGAGIAAVQLLPSAELYFNSGRSTIALSETLFSFLLPIQSIVTFLAPDIFGHPATHNFFRGGAAQYYEGIMFVGVAAVIFATFAVFYTGLHLRGVRTFHLGGDNKLVIFLAIFGMVALSTTLDLPTSKLFLSLPVPFLSTSIANRILFIPAFCIAVLGAIGFDQWLLRRDRKIFKIILAFGLSYLLIAFYLLLVRFFNFPYIEFLKFSPKETAVISLRNLVVPVAVFATTVLMIIASTVGHWLRREIAAVLIMGIAFLHIFYFSQKYFSFSEAKYVFPPTPILDFLKNNQGYSRSWGVGEAALGNNFASQYSLFWPEGYDSLNNRSYGEFTYAMQGNNIEDFYLRSDAGLGAVGDAKFLIENQNRRRLLNMLGIKYVVAKSGDFEVMEANNFKKAFEHKDYGVFENPQVLARIFLASSYEGPPNLADVTNLTTREIDRRRRKLIFQKLLSSDFDFRNSLILEKPSPISPQFGEGEVEVVSYKSQEVIVKTRSLQPKLLFISDNYYLGWKAEVDGEETEILRANYTFRAVPLTRGEHEVRFYYDPDTFKAGLLISLISLGFIGLVIFGRNLKFTI